MLRNGFSIGHIFGINIRIDWSWLFILALVTWNLSVIFGDTHPQWSTGERWGIGLGVALLFFASVLAHELAHSLVAKAQGIPVRSITLFLFGGVSNIQQDPSSPGAEFLMAFVGPLTSIVLGVILLLVAGAGIGAVGVVTNPIQFLSQLSVGSVILVWLGSINVILGAFNLIPGFPLDGGRVLRSILWGLSGNLRRATRWASWVGQAIAWVMIIAGISMVFGVQIPFFGTGLISGLWLAFIGWFLNTASSQSYQQFVVHDILEGVPVERIMRTDPPTVPEDSSVSTLVHDHAMGGDDYGFPVVYGDRLVGIVTLDDVRRVPHQEWDSTSIRAIMTPADRLITVTPDEDGADALNKLAQNDVRQLPVVRGNELVGLLRRQDIVRWLQEHAEMYRSR
jgi:Zn-dependent protease/predicted transcriptional regulator